MSKSATAIQCPSCGAPIPMDPSIVVYRCAFCQHEVRLPDDHTHGSRVERVQMRRHGHEEWAEHKYTPPSSSGAGAVLVVMVVLAIVGAVIAIAASSGQSHSSPSQVRRHY
ncbi:MAG: hypothetical protein ABIP39_14935 [Polyangiaceae bacterium]